MAFDQSTRNRLARFVSDARRILTDEFTRQCKQDYGIDPDTGEVSELSRLTHLNDTQRATARILRETLDHYLAGSPSGGKKASIDRIVREQAFTTLNRLCAVRMAEARGIVIESVSKGPQSKGFLLYARVAGTGLGETADAYRCYLFSIFDEIALDLPPLFDRFSPKGRLFPSATALDALLAEINHADLEPLWGEDETIGWLYQYFNSIEERKQMRDESAAPRNSRELAVRNQFFTPRYVVEFLTDNTLGRIWYEMNKGETVLKDTCRYLVRRPSEIFLDDGQAAPPQEHTPANLSQEELLKRPVHIPHRPLKDPREIRLLDPACGSMHFGLYAFDLFATIYDEAWEIARGSADDRADSAAFAPFVAFAATFTDKVAFLREVPRLIIEHNIHGIDIDPRAVQIAGLSLWLRAQRAWHQAGVRPPERPRIARSHIVCAEPMPGEKTLLQEFVQQQFQENERPVFGFLLEQVFDQMKLAGEAGSLLRVEEEIRSAVAEAKRRWKEAPKYEQSPLFPEAAAKSSPGQMRLDLSGITDDQFWGRAEQRIYDALKAYSERAENGGGFQRRLFANDAAQGFAFIDLCRQRYDVAVMNPPFGDASLPSKQYIDETYGDTKGDVYKAFVECFHERLVRSGYLGIISSRSGFFLGQSEDWRTRVVLRLFRPIVLADLGSGVLDAMVEVAAYVLRSLSALEARDLTISLVPALERVVRDSQDRFSLPKWQAARHGLKRHQAAAELEHLEVHGFVHRSPGDIVRYTPLWRAVKAAPTPAPPAFPPLVCIRAVEEKEKGRVLLSSINGAASRNVFVCDPASFGSVPGVPFSYWVGADVRGLFQNHSTLESNGRNARQGTVTADDFRFARLWWEIPARDLASPNDHPSQPTGSYCVVGKRWVPFAKGGIFAPYYLDIYLVINWRCDGNEIRTFANPATGKTYSRPQNTDWFYKPAITWSARTTSAFAARIMPTGCAFSHKGPAVFTESVSALLALVAIMNTAAFRECLGLQLSAADAAARSYEVGIIQRTPVPTINNNDTATLAKYAQAAWFAKFAIGISDLTSHAFVGPALVLASGESLADRIMEWTAHVRSSEDTFAGVQAKIDDLGFRLYGLAAADRSNLAASPSTEITSKTDAENSEDEEAQADTPDSPALTADLLAYALGCAFGRWDVRFAVADRPVPGPPDPLAPLPVCPPGMLQGDDGLPISPEIGCQLRTEGRYPLDVAWDGVLVDDSDHPLDVDRRVRVALAIIYGYRSEAMEHEACTLLGARTLREWFRRPAGFFADHLRRYSKSRRQAPIYWPLSTSSGSYTLWLYYHRLTDQTLFKAVNDFVEPKLQQIASQAAALRARTSRSSAGVAELERLSDFQIELMQFRDELLRLAKVWKPNLNDGVVITAAPLWKLFQYKPWQKNLRETWEALESGEYDWAHLAYSLWSDRVREKCKHDKSLAIAHGLEELYQEPPATAGKKRGRKAKVVDPELMEDAE